MRIGDQFVRGDNLTGAGGKAPSWIPEKGLNEFHTLAIPCPGNTCDS